MLKQFPNYIGGEWVAASPSWAPNRNPSDLNDVIGEYAQADAEQSRTAVAAARKAFASWSVSSIQDRANILGLSFARVHGLDVAALREQVAGDDIEQRKREGLKEPWSAL